MNTNKNTEKKLRRTIKSTPSNVVPMVDAMDAWGTTNRSSNFVEHRGIRKFWQIVILTFMACLGYWAYDIHKQYTLFNQQALCNAVVMQKQKEAPTVISSAPMVIAQPTPIVNPSNVETPLVSSSTTQPAPSIPQTTIKTNATPTAALALEKNKNTEDVHPSLKLVNKPKNPTIVADLKTDTLRDTFDTAEENFIESQTGQEFSRKETPLFTSTAPTVTQEQAPFKTTPNPQDIQQWLLQQHIKGVAYKDFESCFILNSKIFHLNEVVQPEYNLIWSDIDPVDKKLFFSDDTGHLYTVNY